MARTGIPATKAVEVLNGRLQHEVIKTGFQEGGLRTKFDMEKEYAKNRDRLKRNSQALARLLKCDIYINGCSAVAVGTSAAGLRIFTSVVESCFVKNEDPVTVARRLKLDRKTYRLMNKLEGLCL